MLWKRLAFVRALPAVAMLAVVVPPATAAVAAETTLKIGTHGMQATLIAPDGAGPFPGVIVLHTSGGLEDADLAYARNLAKQGYVCLVPAFMAAYGIASEDRQETFTRYRDDIESDLAAGVATLHQDARVGASPVGAIGFSNGGYFAAWLALSGKANAGVGYYGAYPAGGTNRDESELAAVATGSSSPFLILHGEDDETVPVNAAKKFAAILKAANARYDIHLYPDAGHRFERIGLPPGEGSGAAGGRHGAGSRGGGGTGGSGGSGQSGTVPAGDSAAAADAWSATLAFFTANLHPH